MISADGVVVVDPEYVKGRKVYGQIVCTFRYGKEEDEIMGLSFQKELVMASQEITPNPKKEITKMQVTMALNAREDERFIHAGFVLCRQGSPDEEDRSWRHAFPVRVVEEHSTISDSVPGW